MKTESKDAKKLHTGRQFSYELIKKYRQKLIDKKTGKFSSSFTEKRPCPVCHKSNYYKIFDKSGGTYVKCNNCSMIFINPVFKESALKIYYKNLNTGQAIIAEREKDFYREIYTTGLQAIKNVKKIPGKILDIGCSSGFFLDIAKENNWQTYGIEPCGEEAKMCKGHVLFTDNLENLHLKTKFDAITMWDVFEHIPNGGEQLKLLKTVLAKDGVIFMQTPNSNSLATRIMREEAKMFDGLEHVNLYNPKTIKLIAENNGFQIIYLATAISEIAVLNNYLSYNDPYFGVSDFKSNLLLGLIDENFVHKNLLGYKMQVIIKRK